MLKKTAELHELPSLISQAEQGDAEAMYKVVWLIDFENLTADDPGGEIQERRIRYLRHLVQRPEYPEAAILLANAYARGNGVPQAPNEAIRWYKKAVEAGIKFGNECIGMLYFEGRGVPVDHQKAFEHFIKDPGEKSYCTTYALGEMYRQGLYVEKSAEKACEYYAQITGDYHAFSELDDFYWRACYRLGRAKHYGVGTKKDLPEAISLIDKAKKLCAQHAVEGDISREELTQEWVLLNRDANRL
jgi:hypothetical protein